VSVYLPKEKQDILKLYIPTEEASSRMTP